MPQMTWSFDHPLHRTLAGVAGSLRSLLVALMFTAFSSVAMAANFAVDTASTALTGLWWNQNEPGWGAAITQQYGMIFVTIYSYDNNGTPVWYVASNSHFKNHA